MVLKAELSLQGGVVGNCDFGIFEAKFEVDSEAKMSRTKNQTTKILEENSFLST